MSSPIDVILKLKPIYAKKKRKEQKLKRKLKQKKDVQLSGDEESPQIAVLGSEKSE